MYKYDIINVLGSPTELQTVDLTVANFTRNCTNLFFSSVLLSCMVLELALAGLLEQNLNSPYQEKETTVCWLQRTVIKGPQVETKTS